MRTVRSFKVEFTGPQDEIDCVERMFGFIREALDPWETLDIHRDSPTRIRILQITHDDVFERAETWRYRFPALNCKVYLEAEKQVED